MPRRDTSLAIVIPAYKAAYLDAALESLAAQTDRGFKVYVGDDASPEPLASAIERHRARLEVVYRRFETNLGASRLAAQWNRCVRLSEESWVWLFSDDDLADPGCVAAWRAAVESDPAECDLYRFNTRTIDRAGRTLRWNPPHPSREDAIEFAYHRLMCQRLSFACEYIFARRAFERAGGFVEFPAAWCSDDASWISFAEEGGIRAVQGPLVGWRYSGDNLSAPGPATARLKRDALLAYAEWLARRFAGRPSPPGRPDWAALQRALPTWFLHQLAVADVPFDRASYARVCAIAGQPAPSGAAAARIAARIAFRRARARMRARLSRATESA